MVIKLSLLVQDSDGSDHTLVISYWHCFDMEGIHLNVPIFNITYLLQNHDSVGNSIHNMHVLCIAKAKL